MLLADMGADVIKIESTLLGDASRVSPPFFQGESLAFASVNRNKRSLAVNYRKAEGRQLLLSLIATADVVLEGFKPGQAQRLSLDYEAAAAVNESIVYCSLTGYGQRGAYARRAGHDLSFLALSGTLDLLRAPGGRPVIPAFQLADVAGGALFATIAVLAALLERSHTGRGQYLDASIWQGTASLLSLQMLPALAGVSARDAYRRYLAGAMPGYNVYETADGHYMALAAIEPVLWTDFCRAVDREDLLSQHVPEAEEGKRVAAEVAGIFRQRTRAEWEEFLADKDLCCEPVLALEEVGDYVRRLGGPLLQQPLGGQGTSLVHVASPRALASTDRAVSPAPALGQHTVELLGALGYSPEEITGLRNRRIVATQEDVNVKPYRGLPSTPSL